MPPFHFAAIPILPVLIDVAGISIFFYTHMMLSKSKII